MTLEEARLALTSATAALVATLLPWRSGTHARDRMRPPVGHAPLRLGINESQPLPRVQLATRAPAPRHGRPAA